MTDVVRLYCNDMPSSELFTQEHTRWKIWYLAKAASERPSSCASALTDCDKDLYPNTYTLLQTACTLPVTSCECERNASTLRRLRNFESWDVREQAYFSSLDAHLL